MYIIYEHSDYCRNKMSRKAMLRESVWYATRVYW